MTVRAVSYTHLDVYKRQEERHPGGAVRGEQTSRALITAGDDCRLRDAGGSSKGAGT